MSPVQWAIRPLRKLTDFRSRAPRSEYWWFILLWAVLFLGAQGIDLATGTSPKFGEPGWMTVILCVALFVPALGVSVRRLHDVGRSGWYLLWYVIPLVGTVLVLIQMLSAGSYGQNPYGPDPLSSRQPLGI